jgi:predicted nuclease with TOPRIM domain
MPKDRHKGTQIRAWLDDVEFPRFDRLTAGCNTMKEAILKLIEDAEKNRDVEQKLKDQTSYNEKLCKDLKEQQSRDEKIGILRNEVETLESQNKKFIEDLKNKDRKIEELEKQSKIQPQPQPQPTEVIKEVPNIERTIYIEEDDWLPEYFPFENQEEYEKWLKEF